MSVKISTEHKTSRQDTLRVHPEDVKPGRNSRMIAAANYLDVVQRLAVSVAKHGQLQPAEVRRLPDNTLELVDGQTRHDAIKALREGFEAIDPDTGEAATFKNENATLWVKVSDMDADTAFLHSIKANQDREDTTDLQEALAHNELRTTMGWTDTKIARFYGYGNQNRVMTLEKLLRCPPDVQNAVHEGRMALSVAILGVEHDLTPEEQLKLLEESSSDGKVNGPALKQLLRELLAKKGPDLPAAADPILPAGTPDDGEGGVEEGEEEDPKSKKFIKRSAKDFERFFVQNKEDTTAVTDKAAELMNILVLWFKGRRTDEYLRNAFNEATGK